MIYPDDYGQIWLGVHDDGFGESRGRYVAVTRTVAPGEGASGLAPVSLHVGVPGGSVRVYLNLEEARAVLAQLEAVTEEVAGQVVA